MDTSSLLIAAMAEQCKDRILRCDRPALDLPLPLQPAHLEWMCGNISAHAEDWPTARLHRWIGFVQCAMLAHRMLDLDELKATFDEAKVAHGEVSEDLLDHLDTTSSYEVDIGGEG